MNELGIAASHDLSFVALFLQADPIVKGVMILLALASLGCWTIIIDKLTRFGRLRRQAHALESVTHAGEPLHPSRSEMTGRVVFAGQEAWRDKDPTESRAERRERIERAMRAALFVDLRQLQVGLTFLATTGSAAPFIGLFGTVWGIMNSFSAIAASQDTSLAVVAPGIAEALFATAIGLVAAIPAVIAYNKLTSDLSRVQQSFTTVITILGDRLARDRTQIVRAEAAE
ncbi:MotA/TolQ/ExbB proton channel family protein [Microvirga puerhi]|uniref:MotA/TolQ/ExbB proton channel family protein n=1 Tax=Microvirga puerhi TaxID=2876078 RepID=A0ABS7VN86_9HYPH|nr:MotA/TolQ/ExbB proton channel family protein [Microvirga puerhi]MBZ6076986.1 MotA/TolQ/ExbB proton channel family protein [Microvirga puerhi]